MKKAWDAEDWKGVGQQGLIMLASAAKIDAPDLDTQIEIRNA
jgi:hypothetical protein